MPVVSSLFSRSLAAGLCAGLLATTVLAAERNLVPAASKAQPASEPRIALVIGNADCPNSPLANLVNDAVSIAERLTRLRFNVTRLENAIQDQMYEAIRAFDDQLRGGGVGLFCYAGHALQVRGRNDLPPVRARIERAAAAWPRPVAPTACCACGTWPRAVSFGGCLAMGRPSRRWPSPRTGGSSCAAAPTSGYVSGMPPAAPRPPGWRVTPRACLPWPSARRHATRSLPATTVHCCCGTRARSA